MTTDDELLYKCVVSVKMSDVMDDVLLYRTKMEPYTPEYTVISNCTMKLEKALKDNRDIVHFLERTYFITKDIHDTVLSATCPLTPLEKSGRLVEKIRDKIELNSQNFYVLMKEFKSHKEIYQDIIDILELEMKRQGIIFEFKNSG